MKMELVNDFRILVIILLYVKVKSTTLVHLDKVQSHARMVLKALQSVKATGLSRVIVEGCWRELFRLLRTTGPCLANYGVLVDDIMCLAKDCFVLSFNCTHANCNRAAKALATEALSSLSEQMWLEDFSTVILPIVQSDY